GERAAGPGVSYLIRGSNLQRKPGNRLSTEQSNANAAIDRLRPVRVLRDVRAAELAVSQAADETDRQGRRTEQERATQKRAMSAPEAAGGGTCPPNSTSSFPHSLRLRGWRRRLFAGFAQPQVQFEQAALDFAERGLAEVSRREQLLFRSRAEF